MAIQNSLEYRFNFLADTFIQPILTCGIELMLWWAVFQSIKGPTLAGFTLEQYYLYAVWAAFVARVSSNWMYEYRMIEEIDSGTINGLLARPLSFSQYYLFQLLGYKSSTLAFSIVVPLTVHIFMIPLNEVLFVLLKLPLFLFIIFLFIVFLHFLSLLVSSFAFFFNRVHSLTMAKNIFLWMFTGELFPLDLLPQRTKEIFLLLPFSCAVYVPVGFLTGRVGIDQVYQSLGSLMVAIALVALVSSWLWRRGLRSYVGTGA